MAVVYGVIIADYYLVKGGKLDPQQLFKADETGAYCNDGGWNKKALVAFLLPAAFSVACVWVEAIPAPEGISWVIGAALGGAVYWQITRKYGSFSS